MSMKKLAERWVAKDWIKPIETPPAKLQRPKTKEEIEAAALAEHESMRSKGQITFYPYDRGQCYNKGSRAIMAFVNLPGSCAHYIFVEDVGEWEFVQFPHMSTEKRCAERSGYRSVEELRAYLFPFFSSYIVKNDLFGFAPLFGSFVLDRMGELPELPGELPAQIDESLKSLINRMVRRG